MRFSTHFRSGGSTFVQLPTRENAFCRPLPSLFLQTFSSTDSSFVRTVCGMTGTSSPTVCKQPRLFDNRRGRYPYRPANNYICFLQSKKLPKFPGFPAKPQVLWGGFLVSRFSFLVFKTLYGCWNSSASFDKHFGRSGIHLHNGAAAEQTAEVKLVPCFFADSGDNAYSGGL